MVMQLLADMQTESWRHHLARLADRYSLEFQAGEKGEV